MQRRQRRSARRRKSATPLRVQPAQTMLLAMADTSPQPEKWWGHDDCTTTGDNVSTSPCGGVSPVSLGSPDEVSAPRRDVRSSVPQPNERKNATKAAESVATHPGLWWEVIASLLLFVVRRLGIGRAPEACLTWRQHLWFLANRQVLEQAPMSVCPELTALGESGNIWDAFQVFMVVATRGSIYAERHGALTRDGHLLVVHRLRMAPSSLRARLIPMEDASLLGLIWTRLFGHGSVGTSDSVEVLPGKQVLLFQHGLLESSMNWVTSATPLSDPFLTRCRQAVTAEVAALYRLMRFGVPITRRGERLADINQVCASLPLALMLGDRDFGRSSSRSYSSLAQCLRVVQPLGDLHLEDTVNDDQPLFDIWLSNSRGNFFTTRVDHTQSYEPPLGHKPLCLKTFRCLNRIYDEAWTHFDMAGEDIDAVYRSILGSVRPTATLNPICVGFSQGASILLMNSHNRVLRGAGDDDLQESPFDGDVITTRPKGLILLCPPVVLQPQEVLPMKKWPISVTMKHLLSWDRVVAILVNLGLLRMDLLGKVVEPVLNLAPAKSLGFADSFVRRALCFHRGRVEGRGHIWSYKMTPNGLTSSRNIACFRRCIKGAPDYEHGLDTIAAQSLPSLGKLCPVHIFLALDDNIANGAQSLNAIRAQCPQARRRVLDIYGRLKWCDPVGDETTDLVVSMVEGHSHLDMTWTSGCRQAIHHHIFATINYLISLDPPA